MNAIRRALHEAADLIADAMEQDQATAPAPRTKRRYARAPAPIPDVVMSDTVREKVMFQLRKHGMV